VWDLLIVLDRHCVECDRIWRVVVDFLGLQKCKNNVWMASLSECGLAALEPCKTGIKMKFT
jgi:hypothetical protein